MVDPERRSHARGNAGARVTFSEASSDAPLEGHLRDVGRGGLFVMTEAPLAIGKRIDFEVHVSGASIVGTARVIWVREVASGDLPAGMGIKFIDVDDSALVGIDRLAGLKKNVRERTILGMMAPKPDAAKTDAAKPKVRERTILGIPAPAVAREKELSWPDDPPPAAPPPPRDQELSWPDAPADPPVTAEAKTVQVAMPPDLNAPAFPPPRSPSTPPPPPPPPVEPPLPPSSPSASIAAPKSKPPRAIADAKPLAPRELPKRESGNGLLWIVVAVAVIALGGTAFALRDRMFGSGPQVSSSDASSSPPTTTAIATAPPTETETMVPIVRPVPTPTFTQQPVAIDLDAGEITDASHHDGGRHRSRDAGVRRGHGRPTGSASAAPPDPN